MELAIILLVAGVVIAIIEVFVPSGGILGILSGCAIVAGIVLAFMEDKNIGLIFLAVSLVLIPTLVIIGFKVFPNTPIGRRVILSPSTEKPENRGIAGVNDVDYSVLVGKTGKTITSLRPSGIAEIEDERYSVVSEGVMVDSGVDIVVIEIEGNSIVVEEKT